ncbi:MAG: helix-turn-helix domain-containing protein [Spirosomataceae bacterium]
MNNNYILDLAHPRQLFEKLNVVLSAEASTEEDASFGQYRNHTVIGSSEMIPLENDNFAMVGNMLFFEERTIVFSPRVSKNWLMIGFFMTDSQKSGLSILEFFPTLGHPTFGHLEVHPSYVLRQLKGDTKFVLLFLDQAFLSERSIYLESQILLRQDLMQQLHRNSTVIQKELEDIGILSLFKTINFREENDVNRKKQLIGQFIEVYLNHLFGSYIRKTFKSHHHLEKMREAERRMTADFTVDSYNLKELSEMVGVSTKKFQILFKEMFGASYYHYYQKKRFEYVQDLILHHHFSVKQAAQAIGYKNLTFFSRQFKRIMGISPMTLKKQRGPKK